MSGHVRAPVLAALALSSAFLTGAVCGPPGDADPRASVAGAPSDPEFEEIRLEVGFPTSDALVLDTDRDGRPEAVLTGRGRIVVAELGRDGAPRVVETAPAGENSTGLAAGDLDGDGWPDLVVANHETDFVTLLFGSPTGFADGRRERLVVGVDPHPHAARVADVDGDGNLDLVVDDRGAGALRLHLGRGDGTFVESDPVDVGGDPYRGMALADLDGDGDVDVVTPNPFTATVRLNDGSGRFTPGPELRVEGVRPFGVAVTDVNGDGQADVGVAGGEGEETFAVWLGGSDGTFELEPGSPRRIAEGPGKVRTGDVDGDGLEDFLVASYVGGGVAVVLGGAGGLRVVRLHVEGSPWGVAAADFDGDGDTDLVTANDGRDHVSFFVAR